MALAALSLSAHQTERIILTEAMAGVALALHRPPEQVPQVVVLETLHITHRVALVETEEGSDYLVIVEHLELE